MPSSNDYVMFVIVNIINSFGHSPIRPITGCMLCHEWDMLEKVKIGGVKIDAYVVAKNITPLQWKKFHNKLTYCDLLTKIKQLEPKTEIVCK